MEKKDDTQVGIKPEAEKPAGPKAPMKQARWSGMGGNSGAKNSKSVHSRMPTGRGSARGR